MQVAIEHRFAEVPSAGGVVGSSTVGGISGTTSATTRATNRNRPDYDRALEIHSRREFTLAGCLVNCGASLSDGYRQVGVYAAKMLKGDLTTAKALGLTVPPTLLARR